MLHILKIILCTAAVILNYSGKREKRKLIYFSERKNNQGLKAVHPLQGGSNATVWYKDTRHQIVPVQVEGQPEMDTQSSKEVSSSPTPERKENTEPCPVRMMIDIRMTNGIRIQQRNLTYRNLRSLIEKLEGLC